jgi:uncharacterized membrane-anchored protein YitT (DUF2179 family)
MKLKITKKQFVNTAFAFLIICAGAFGMAFGNMAFVNPYDIVPGGFTGIAIILDKALLHWGFPGMIALALNAPLFIAAWRIKGVSFGFLSLIGTVVYAVFIDLIPRFGIDMSNVTEGNELLATIYGGVCMGIGYGVIIRAGGSTGGTDTLSNVLNALKPNLSFGTILLSVDGAVVAASAVAFGVTPALYAFLVIVISAFVADFVIEGKKSCRAYTIICADPDAMAREIFAKIRRGVTAYRARGMYTKKDREVLVCVVLRNQGHALKHVVYAFDPKAFVYSERVTEVYGEGFNPGVTPPRKK